MKTIPRSFLISLVPLLTPMSAMAETSPKTNLVAADSASAASKVTAASWRASQVIGTNVKNAVDDTIGEIEDLVVDMKSGEILAVVISSGGFLGVADTLSAVPVSAVRYDVDAKAFKTKLTKEQLQGAPQFKTNAWPDYSDESTADKLRSYRDSIGGDVTAPDNTARNEKEMTEGALDPTDQGGSDADVQTTKKIRSGVMDADLSFNAKNIKIITKGGNVTLKGVVKDHAEHEAILKIAKSHAGDSKITDELKMDDK